MQLSSFNPICLRFCMSCNILNITSSHSSAETGANVYFVSHFEYVTISWAIK